ncbi:uncharacterized protein DEA37_0008201 [Paragonimus westermani]|uniref:Delta-like protein n=1 Tax=Paragonimus westermani TaxID=34504 RepID=A0A5J4NYC6_9TREM|nr:uncharacterized protein DEA37_0008201 [Paragonimus westermani]
MLFSLSLRDYIKLCKLFHYTTRVYKKVITLEESVAVPISQPLPKLFTFEITAISTLYNENNKIGTFLASRFRLSTNGEVKSLRMSRIAHGYKNLGLSSCCVLLRLKRIMIYFGRIKVNMTLRCDKNYYGDRCHLYCDPEAQTYTCTPEGRRICRAEYRGPLCDIRDWCLLKPCAANSTCVLRLDGEGRKCICNGRDNMDCYPDFNPCDPSPCKNNGTCVSFGTYENEFFCNCTKSWTGITCNERRSHCLDTTQLQAAPSNTSLESMVLCHNDGVCVEDLDEVSPICKCKEGWQGERCNVPDGPFPKTTLLAISLPLLILFTCAVGFAVCKLREKRKLREGILDKSTTPVHFYESTVLQNDGITVDQRSTCSTSPMVSQHSGSEDVTHENLTSVPNGSTHSEVSVNGTVDGQHQEPKCVTRTLPEPSIPVDQSILKNPAKTINTVKDRSQYNLHCERKPRVFRRVHYNEPVAECKQYFV